MTTQKRNLLSTLIAIVALQIGFSSAAQAASVNMTCKQAIAYYQKYKLIYVKVTSKFNGKTATVPIYGQKPISVKYNCPGKKNKTFYKVKTTDKKKCAIASTC